MIGSHWDQIIFIFIGYLKTGGGDRQGGGCRAKPLNPLLIRHWNTAHKLYIKHSYNSSTEKQINITHSIIMVAKVVNDTQPGTNTEKN